MDRRLRLPALITAAGARRRSASRLGALADPPADTTVGQRQRPAPR